MPRRKMHFAPATPEWQVKSTAGLLDKLAATARLRRERRALPIDRLWVIDARPLCVWLAGATGIEWYESKTTREF